MSEAEFEKLLDEYTKETGFDFHTVQKRWAFLAAKDYHQSRLNAVKEEMSNEKIKVQRMTDRFSKKFIEGYESACSDLETIIKEHSVVKPIKK